jgi:protein O-GlcNAc transferase
VALVACAGCNDDPILQPDLRGSERPVQERIEARRRTVDAAPTADNWASYAYALDAHGFLPEAEQAYLRAADLDAKKAFEYFHLAGVAARTVDQKRASEHLLRALSLRDDYMATHLHLADMEEKLERLAEAKERYEVITSRWQSAHAELGLGRVLLHGGDAVAALPHLLKAQGMAPTHGGIHEALARTYALLGRVTESRAAARLVGDLNNDPPFLDPLQQRLAAEEVQSGARFRRGGALADAGQLREAIQELEAGLEVQPGYDAARHFLATVLAQDGQLDKAISHFSYLLKANPTDKDALEARARLFVALNKRVEAQRDIQALLRIDPNNAWARQQRGR